MKYSLHRHFISAIGAIVVGIVLLLILFFILSITWISSIPSRVGHRASIETWIIRGMSRFLDIRKMRRFRNDIFYRIRPHIELAEDFERWWILREMELSTIRTKRSMQSGEFVIVVILAIGGIFINHSVYGIPVSVIFTIAAISLSALILVRVVTMEILVFKPELNLEDSTHDLAVKMGFNQGPFSQGTSIAIALLTLFVGVSGDRAYDLGLDFAERVSSESNPGNDDRWRVD